MEVIEFKARIKDGIIMIPEKYRNKISRTVKVLVLSQSDREHDDIIDKLLMEPIKAKDFVPYMRDEIYDR